MFSAHKGLNLFWGKGRWIKDAYEPPQLPGKNTNKKSKKCTRSGNQGKLCGRRVI